MAPQEVAERAVFSVAGRDYRWADVVRAAELWSRWSELEQAAANGLAALAALPAPIEKPALDEAARAFRYERHLLAAEEMEAWLTHWGLTASEWSDYLRRTLARTRQPAAGEGFDPTERDVWAEAVCSGTLADLARDLAARAAAAEATGLGIDEALAAFEQDALTPEARAKALEGLSADWVRLTYSALHFPEEASAREAELCIREDGLTFAEVAERARVSVELRGAFIEEVEPAVAEPLLSTPVGELVGPLAVGDAFVLLRVDEKIAPTLADPVIEERLRAEVPRRAVEREVRSRVQWHERL